LKFLGSDRVELRIIQSESVQKVEKFIGLGQARYFPRRLIETIQNTAFHLQVGFHIVVCGLDILMAEPQGDDRHIHPGLQQVHDCLALRKATDFVLSVSDGKTASNEATIVSVDDIQKDTGFRFGKNKFFCPELDTINRCAYADYQRDKVYLRTSPAMRKSNSRKQRAEKRTLKVNKEEEFKKPAKCPNCGASQIHSWGRHMNRKIILDLRFTTAGVKRWVVRLSTKRYKCWICKETFLADGYPIGGSHLGHALSSWSIYHHVALRQSYDDITLSVGELFGMPIDNLLSRAKPQMAERVRSLWRPESRGNV
jgi:hypothetical protein